MATALNTSICEWGKNNNGMVGETWTIWWNNDAAVEIPTRLKQVYYVGSVRLANGGFATADSVDEASALRTNGKTVVANGTAFTLDGAGNTTSHTQLLVLGI